MEACAAAYKTVPDLATQDTLDAMECQRQLLRQLAVPCRLVEQRELSDGKDRTALTGNRLLAVRRDYPFEPVGLERLELRLQVLVPRFVQILTVPSM